MVATSASPPPEDWKLKDSKPMRRKAGDAVSEGFRLVFVPFYCVVMTLELGSLLRAPKNLAVSEISSLL